MEICDFELSHSPLYHCWSQQWVKCCASLLLKPQTISSKVKNKIKLNLKIKKIGLIFRNNLQETVHRYWKETCYWPRCSPKNWLTLLGKNHTYFWHISGCFSEKQNSWAFNNLIFLQYTTKLRAKLSIFALSFVWQCLQQRRNVILKLPAANCFICSNLFQSANLFEAKSIYFCSRWWQC